MSVEPELIAKVAHEVNRVLQADQAARGDISIQVSPPWAEAPEGQRRSAIDGVLYHQANPGVSPAQSHENWCNFKSREGWVYGPVKDEDAKTHPCLVPFEELPSDQQVKDSMFAAVVEALS